MPLDGQKGETMPAETMTHTPMTTTDRAARVRAVIKAGIEPTEVADAALVVIGEHSGKPLSKRLADALTKATGTEWQVDRSYGMAHVETLAYARSDWAKPPTGPRLRILLAHSDTNVTIPDAETVAEKNPAYFAAAKERNAKRRAVLAGTGLPPDLDSVTSALDDLARAYEHARELCETIKPGYNIPDWYAIRRELLPESMHDSNQSRHVSTDLS